MGEPKGSADLFQSLASDVSLICGKLQVTDLQVVEKGKLAQQLSPLISYRIATDSKKPQLGQPND